MNAKPTLMHGRSIDNLFAGRKTQTRRILNPQPPEDTAPIQGPEWFEPEVESKSGESEPGAPVFGIYDEDGEWGMKCPKGAPGDLLYVRETFWAFGRWETRFSEKKGRDEWHFIDITETQGFEYRYDTQDNHGLLAPIGTRAGQTPAWHKRPAIFMPRRASRLTLRLTDVRVERVQQISPADCDAEGCSVLDTLSGYHRGAALHTQFIDLWDQTNGKGAYERNDWCWVLCFEVIQANVDDVLADPVRYGINAGASA